MKFHFYKLALRWQHTPYYKWFIHPWYNQIVKYKKKRRSQLLKTIGPELLSIVFTNLRKANIACWLEFGSLLGACREKNFIKHDDDIDVGAFYKDRDEIKSIFTKSGLKLKHQFEVKGNPILGFEQTYIYKGLTIDVFYFHKDTNDLMHCNSFGAYNSDYKADFIPVKEITVPFSGFTDINFKNTTVKIPKDWEKHLIAHYGKQFMIPDAQFDYRKEATNIKYFSKSEREGIFIEF